MVRRTPSDFTDFITFLTYAEIHITNPDTPTIERIAMGLERFDLASIMEYSDFSGMTFDILSRIYYISCSPWAADQENIPPLLRIWCWISGLVDQYLRLIKTEILAGKILYDDSMIRTAHTYLGNFTRYAGAIRTIFVSRYPDLSLDVLVSMMEDIP